MSAFVLCSLYHVGYSSLGAYHFGFQRYDLTDLLVSSEITKTPFETYPSARVIAASSC